VTGARFATARSGGLAVVRFEPADRRGVLDEAALASLRQVLAELGADASLRLAVLEGAREDLFAAGADLETVAALTPGAALAFAELGREAIAAWESLEATTVAVVRGACFGGALDLVLASDLIVAFPAARFAHPGVRRGILTGWAGTVRARRRLSPAALHELFVEAEPVVAERALANGLVDLVVGGEEELGLALERWMGPLGDELRRFKRVTRAVEGLSLGTALEVEARLEKLYSGQ